MKLLAIILVALATITLASPGAQAVSNHLKNGLDHRKKEADRKQVLRNCHISFHTNNEDKDSDTHVTVTLTSSDGVAAARISNDFGHFDDNSDDGPYALTVLNQSQKGALQSGKITIRIDPNGHDTWRFNFFLDMTFSDGSRLSGGADRLELTQNRRDQTFGIDGIVR